MSEHVAGYETKRTRAASAVFTVRGNAIAVYTVIMCPSVRLSVCLSVTSRYCIETTGRIELTFGRGACFHLSHAVLKGKLDISKN